MSTSLPCAVQLARLLSQFQTNRGVSAKKCGVRLHQAGVQLELASADWPPRREFRTQNLRLVFDVTGFGASAWLSAPCTVSSSRAVAPCSSRSWISSSVDGSAQCKSSIVIAIGSTRAAQH